MWGYSFILFPLFFPLSGIAHVDSLEFDSQRRQLQQPSFSSKVSTQLQNEQDSLAQELQQIGTPKRALYERYFPILSVDGILSTIETLWPHCHSEAHDLGKVIYAKAQDVIKGLTLCDNRCHSGCMHGVLMEAMTTIGLTDSSALNFKALRPLVSQWCLHNPLTTTSYSPGDCAHGVGHAFSIVADYSIEEALKGCGIFENEKAAYYCSTGVFMEYVNTFDESDNRSKSLFYPCDVFPFPAACARYKMVHIVRRHYQADRALKDLKEQCRQFPPQVRLGCFHGLGNAHVPYLAKGLVSLKQVCEGLTSNEEIVCIDGAIERMAKYHELRALEVCQEFHEKETAYCLSAVKHKMYDMDKDLTLYLRK